MEGKTIMICPYCEQGSVLPAKVKRDGRSIHICEECDTVWMNGVDQQSGVSFHTFMQHYYDTEALWDELEVGSVTEI